MNAVADRIRREAPTALALLRWYRAFLASPSQFAHAPREMFPRLIDKTEARERLEYLLDVAINRRAGWPDEPCRKASAEYQHALRRDQRALAGGARIYAFETSAVRRRFRALECGYGEES